MRIVNELTKYLQKRRQQNNLKNMTTNELCLKMEESYLMSRGTYFSYKKSGFVKANPMKEEMFLAFFTILFPLNSQNYRLEAVNTIIYLRDNLGESSVYINRYIDSNYYIHSINHEKVEKSTDQFTAFLQSSMFHQYIFSLFNLDTKGYSPSPIGKNDHPEEDIKIGNKDLDSYMTQTLYDSFDPKEQPLFSTDDGNLDFFDKKGNKLLLITGPGGQGKTTFVKKISEQKYLNNLFADVFIVPLVDLTTKDLNSSYSKNNLVFEFIKEIYDVDILENEDKKFIIALDGYNEFRTANNKKAVSAITDSINDIISDIHTLERTNISLVITTRDIGTTKQIFPCFEHFKCMVLSGTSQEKYSLLKKLCESQGILFETEKGNKTEIGELAEIPMYANMIYELVFLKNGLKEEKSYSNQPIKNMYSLFFEAYLRRAMQKTESSMSKNNYDRSAYLYFYYVIMPYIAYAKITSKETFNEYSVDETELNGFVSDLRNNKYVEVAYENIRHNLFPYVERGTPNIDEYELIELFLGEDNIISKDLESHTYKFEHEAWRDFLVALYLKNNIEVLKKHYLDNDSEIALTLPLYLNVNSNTSKLIRQSIGVYGSSEENAVRFYDYFKISATNLNRLAGVLRFSNLAYDFCEYLQVDLPLGESRENDTLHKVLFACSSEILELSNNPKFLDTIMSDSRIAEYVCNVLGKEGEYYRRTKDYQKVFEIVEFCTRISDNNYFIQNQNAKLHLSYYQSVVLQEEIISTPDCFIGKDIETIFQNGLEILKQPVQNGFYLSVNIYGLIITYPSPYLLYNSSDLRIEYNSAFKAYLKTIFESESQGREISYTVRQALGLLIKHGVRLSPDNQYNPFNEWKNDLCLLHLSQCYEKNSIDEATLSFTKDLLKRADGQDLTGLNYLRGCVALFCKEKDKAEEYFKSPVKDEIDLLYKIRLNYEFGYHEDLDTRYSDLCEKIVKNLNGEYDKTHFVYFYLEGKQLELSYVSGAEQEKRLDFFRGLEIQFGISDLCNRIETIL